MVVFILRGWGDSQPTSQSTSSRCSRTWMCKSNSGFRATHLHALLGMFKHPPVTHPETTTSTPYMARPASVSMHSNIFQSRQDMYSIQKTNTNTSNRVCWFSIVSHNTWCLAGKRRANLMQAQHIYARSSIDIAIWQP